VLKMRSNAFPVGAITLPLGRVIFPLNVPVARVITVIQSPLQSHQCHLSAVEKSTAGFRHVPYASGGMKAVQKRRSEIRCSSAGFSSRF